MMITLIICNNIHEGTYNQGVLNKGSASLDAEMTNPEQVKIMRPADRS